KGGVYAAGELSANIQRFDTRGRLFAHDLDVHGLAADTVKAECAWVNARTPASTMAVGRAGKAVRAGGFAFDSLRTNVSYRGQTGGGRVEVAVRQGDERDYGLTGDFVL